MTRLTTRTFLFVLFTELFIIVPDTFAQFSESDLKIFGYFQISLHHQTELDRETTHPQFSGDQEEPARNSFSLQQLNLFFQKDIAKSWRAFINFEFLNNFSSSRQWGSANLEEAWIRYRSSEKFNLKFGLLIPIFNSLNEIKNRTPILPYIVRPLVYETSFNEFIPIEEFVPARAFVQAYGFIPSGEVKLDYAAFLGNSPNIASGSQAIPGQGFQTGVDTTDTFLIGGRVGLRFKEFKLGLSGTRENVNLREVVVQGEPFLIFEQVPRIRLGGDLSFHVGQLSVEAEFINVIYDDELSGISIDKDFYYATMGYQITDQLFAYAGYWFGRADFPSIASSSQVLIITNAEGKIKVPNIGIAYNLNDRIALKGQVGLIRTKDEQPLSGTAVFVEKEKFNFFAIAASVFF